MDPMEQNFFVSLDQTLKAEHCERKVKKGRGMKMRRKLSEERLANDKKFGAPDTN